MAFDDDDAEITGVSRGGVLGLGDRSVSPLRLGYVPGATPGKWAGRFRARVPGTPLELVALPDSEAEPVLLAGAVDAALLRNVVASDAMFAVPLYQEAMAAVVPKGHWLTADATCEAADLIGDTLIVPQEYEWAGAKIAGQARNDKINADAQLLFVIPARGAAQDETRDGPESHTDQLEPATAGEAVEWAAAGLGVAVLPGPVARLHHRKDVVAVPISDLPGPKMSLAWLRENDNALTQELAGVVRGRGANSTRGSAAVPGPKKTRDQRAAKPSRKRAGR